MVESDCEGLEVDESGLRWVKEVQSGWVCTGISEERM